MHHGWFIFSVDISSPPPKIQWKVKSIGEVDESNLFTHIQLLRRLCYFCVNNLKVLSSCPSVDFYCILQYAARVLFSKMQLWPCDTITIQVIWLPFLHTVILWDKPTNTSISGLFLSLGPPFHWSSFPSLLTLYLQSLTNYQRSQIAQCPCIHCSLWVQFPFPHFILKMYSFFKAYFVSLSLLKAFLHL